MNFEENRLHTFQSWPANAVVEPQRIAKAGFFYIGEGLIVECFSCGGRIAEWDYGDQVMAKHRVLNPECPFVKRPTEAGNIPVLKTGSSNASSYRSGTIRASDSLQSNTSGSLLESSSGISSPVGNNDGSLRYHEAGERRNSFHLSGVAGSSRRTFEGHCLSRSSSNNEENRLHGNVHPSLTEVDNQLRYRSEAARLETFRTWPKSLVVSPDKLAKAGFYYLQDEDKVKCAFCSGVVGHWEAGDDPVREHRQHFPSCPLHYNVPVGNIPMGVNTSGMQQYICGANNVSVREVPPFSSPERPERRNVVEHSKSLPENSGVMVEGIQQHRGPRHPKYSTVESRLRTFNDWPSSLHQTPQQLAQAGFYYTGVNDQVRCFHCDGGLRQWDDSDDPWVEHARWFSKCIYVLLMKGEEFIQEVTIQHPPVLQINTAHGKGSKQVKTANRVRIVTEEELDGLMNTIPVQMAVAVGLDIAKIRCSLRQKIEQTGLPYSTSDALIGAVLDMSSNLSRSRSPESPTPGPSQEYVGDHDGSSFQQTAFEKSERRKEGEGLQTEEHENSRTLPSLSVSSLSQLAHADQRIYTLGQASMLPSLDTKKENVKDSSSALLVEENRRLKEARLCKICMDEEVGVVFLPCGHLVTCINCTPSLQDCPLCRQPIKATVRTFLS